MYDTHHHAPWSDQLPHYVAGTLAAAERAALEHHLAACADCRVALREWQLIAAAVRTYATQRTNRSLPLLPNLPQFSRNGHQHKRLEEDYQMIISPAAPTTARRRYPSFTLAAVLLMVLFGGVLLALNARGDHDPAIHSAGNALRLTITLPPTEADVPPTSIPTPFPTLTATTVPGDEDLSESVKLDGIRYEAQSWNNQGPTALAMALSYWGWQGDQQITAAWLKPNIEDKSVSPAQIVYYTNHFTDYRAIYRMGGTTELMKQLLAAGFPVIARKSIQPAGEDWMGHYVLLMGYDDAAGHFLTFDSYLGYNQGDGRPSPYSTFDEQWRHFNRTYIVVYDPARVRELRRELLGDADPARNALRALEATRDEAELDITDQWAWFNMGTSYVALGEYNNAAIAYDQAIRLGLPWRMLWYQFGPYEAYFQIGDYNSVLALANATIATTQYVEEVYYWQLMVYLATDSSQAARAFQHLINANPNYLTALVEEYRREGGEGYLPPGYAEIPGLPPGMIERTPAPVPSPTSTPVPTTELDDLKTALVTIPGGTFSMGHTAEQIEQVLAECAEYDIPCDETWLTDAPQHTTTIDDFQIEKYEVTVEQYVAFLNSIGPSSHVNGCDEQPCIMTKDESTQSEIRFDGTQYIIRQPGYSTDKPVTLVTWWGAQAYCEAIGRRLPTEAEWERAAQGPDGYLYPWGNTFDSTLAMSSLSDEPGLHPVDAYLDGVSAYGVFNMAGNAAEWVADWYAADYYEQEAASDLNPTGPATGTERVVRGGSWDTPPIFLLTTQRTSQNPAYVSAALGFRCAAD